MLTLSLTGLVLGSKRRPVVNPFLAAFSQKSLASAYVFELKLKLQEGRKVFVEIRYFESTNAQRSEVPL